MPLASVERWVSWLKTHRKCPERVRITSVTGADPEDPTRDREFAADERADPVGDDVEREQMSGVAAWLFDPDGVTPVRGECSPTTWSSAWASCDARSR